MRIHHKSRCSLGVGLVGVMFAVITAVSLASFHPTSPTSTAAGGSDFRPGRIIDDVVFYNKDAMNAQQIQDFLNQKVPVCDTLGAKIYSGTKTRAQSGTERGYPPPYICLKDYRQDTPEKVASNYCDLLPAATDQSAAQIIYSVSQACGVNPQVLLVLLQKEQSLVTDDWPFEIQYRSATGYGCPDTAPCDAQYYGFFNQVFRAAWQYKVYRANPNNYNYRAGRNNYIQYNPNASCGGLNVYIENQATAGLYIYTPYVPNQKALENLYGTGDSCSAYGNRNFWRLFGDWFGSTMGLVTGPIADRYDQIKDTLGSPLDVQYCPDSDTCWQEFSYGVIIWNKHTGAWESKGSIRKRWSELGYQDGIMGYPTGPEVKTSDGGWWQFYEHGAIIGKPGTGYWESKGSIRKRWGELGYQDGIMGYPTGPEVKTSDGGWWQFYEHGAIIGKPGTGYWESKGSI
ncbi:hypothetical protein FWC31_01555, partial [Candidatus Saccharibacteria bacterium]|nr:hypothetical protein [Candidatus Saccharibacteria bacterium]